MCSRARALPIFGVYKALVRAIAAVGTPKVSLRTDSEPAIIDLERQVAAECLARHGITVLIFGSTEYKFQDHGLAEVAVREIKGVARTWKFAHVPSFLGLWLTPLDTTHVAKLDLTDKHLHQRKKERAFRKMLLVFGKHKQHILIGNRTSRRQERWSDGLFLGVADRRSDFHVGRALGGVRTRSLRRRPLDERDNECRIVRHADRAPW